MKSVFVPLKNRLGKRHSHNSGKRIYSREKALAAINRTGGIRTRDLLIRDERSCRFSANPLSFQSSYLIFSCLPP